MGLCTDIFLGYFFRPRRSCGNGVVQEVLDTYKRCSANRPQFSFILHCRHTNANYITIRHRQPLSHHRWLSLVYHTNDMIGFFLSVNGCEIASLIACGHGTSQHFETRGSNLAECEPPSHKFVAIGSICPNHILVGHIYFLILPTSKYFAVCTCVDHTGNL